MLVATQRLSLIAPLVVLLLLGFGCKTTQPAIDWFTSIWSGEEVQLSTVRAPAGSFGRLCVSQSGRRVAILMPSGDVFVVDSATGERVSSIEIEHLMPTRGLFVRDDELLVVAGPIPRRALGSPTVPELSSSSASELAGGPGYDTSRKDIRSGGLVFIDVESGKQIGSVGMSRYFYPSVLRLSASGERILVGDINSSLLATVDIRTARVVRRDELAEISIVDVAQFEVLGRPHLAVADAAAGRLIVWDVSLEKPIQAGSFYFGQGSPISVAAADDNLALVAVGNDPPVAWIGRSKGREWAFDRARYVGLGESRGKEALLELVADLNWIDRWVVEQPGAELYGGVFRYWSLSRGRITSFDLPDRGVSQYDLPLDLSSLAFGRNGEVMLLGQDGQLGRLQLGALPTSSAEVAW